MHSFRRLAFLLALALAVMPALRAQTPASSSSNPQQNPPPAQPAQAQQPARQASRPMTVEQRLRERRYLRFTPGPDEQRLTDWGWDTGLTRYFNRRLGVNVDARGYKGIAYVGLNFTNQTRYAVSQYEVMAGPTYRFYIQPKYSAGARVMGGWGLGTFTGDTNGFGTICPPNLVHCLLYPDGSTYAASAALLLDYNFTPAVSLRIAPEYFITGFGSTNQYSRGFTIGLAYRFGKQ
jgi:hypothetical protein